MWDPEFRPVEAIGGAGAAIGLVAGPVNYFVSSKKNKYLTILLGLLIAMVAMFITLSFIQSTYEVEEVSVADQIAYAGSFKFAGRPRPKPPNKPNKSKKPDLIGSETYTPEAEDKGHVHVPRTREHRPSGSGSSKKVSRNLHVPEYDEHVDIVETNPLEEAKVTCAGVIKTLFEFDKANGGGLASFAAHGLCALSQSTHLPADHLFGTMCREFRDKMDENTLDCIDRIFAESSSQLHGLFMAYGDAGILDVMKTSRRATKSIWAHTYKVRSTKIGIESLSVSLGSAKYVQVLRLVEFLENYSLFKRSARDVRQAMSKHEDKHTHMTVGATNEFEALFRRIISHQFSNNSDKEYINGLKDDVIQRVTSGEFKSDRKSPAAALMDDVSEHFQKVKNEVSKEIMNDLTRRVTNLKIENDFVLKTHGEL
jgi:hypothetical protein